MKDNDILRVAIRIVEVDTKVPELVLTEDFKYINFRVQDPITKKTIKVWRFKLKDFRELSPQVRSKFRKLNFQEITDYCAYNKEVHKQTKIGDIFDKEVNKVYYELLDRTIKRN